MVFTCGLVTCCRVEAGICALFREVLSKKGFVELHFPKIISGESRSADISGLDHTGCVTYCNCPCWSPQVLCAVSPGWARRTLAVTYGTVVVCSPRFQLGCARVNNSVYYSLQSE